MPPVAAAFIAVGAGTASVAAIATVVSTVGLGLSVIGKITGNESLTKIGGVMGLVGGVTSIASGFGTVAAAEAGASTMGAAGEGLIAGETGAMDMGLGFGSEASTSAVADSSIGGLLSESPTIGLEALAKTGTFNNQQDAATPSNNSEALEMSPPATGGLLQQSSEPSGASWQTPKAIEAPADTSPGGLGAWWNKQSDSSKRELLRTGAGAVSGLFAGWSAEQKMAFDRERMNLANLSANAQPRVAYQPVSNVAQRPLGGLLQMNKGY